MVRNLALTCPLALPLPAQMNMPMQNMPEHPSPAAAAKRPAPSAAARPSHSPTAKAPEPQGQPFGALADGDKTQTVRSAEEVPTPVILDRSVQEQEHPSQRSGSLDSAVPDLLEAVKQRSTVGLQFFQDRAAAHNPTLRAAEAQVRRLRAEAKQAGLWSNPEIGYEADHVRGGSYAGGEQGGYVQQEIPLAGQRVAARGAVAAQATAAEAALALQQERVRAAVEQAFYAALARQREIELRTRLAELAAEAAVAAHQFANIGQADAPDVLQSEVEREQARMELASAQRNYLKDFAALAAVSGDADLPATPLAGDLAAVPVVAFEDVLAATGKSPALTAAREQATSVDALVRSARKQALPLLTLKGGLQQDNEPLESTRGRVGVVGVAQAGLSIPLWNRNQGGVASARAQQAAAAAEVERVRLTLGLKAAEAQQDYANAMAQAERYRGELLPRAQRAAELYAQKYAAMASAYPQSLLSQKLLLQLQLEYVRVLGTAWQSAILLRHGLVQGGLEPPAAITAARTGPGSD